MEIELSQGKVALVDPEDYNALSKFKWYAHKESGLFYATRQSNSIRMHRVITGANVGQEVDHKNGNGLDNRRANLRFATRSQNAANSRVVHGTSGFRGVTWHRGCRKWQAQISVGKQTKYLGVFSNPKEAHERWKIEAEKSFGEFAKITK